MSEEWQSTTTTTTTTTTGAWPLYTGRENLNLYRQLVCIMTASEVDRLANAISTGDDD